MAKKRRGRSLKISQKRSVPVDWNTLSPVKKFNRVFAVFTLVTPGGADGSILGVNCSINSVSMQLVLESLRVNGKVVCDMEAAD